jgi:hypothetical protein
MKDLPIKDGLSAYAIHNVAKDESGYNYYGYISKDGSVIIFRENVAGTEYRYANGGTNYSIAWNNRTTLDYKTIDNLLI